MTAPLLGTGAQGRRPPATAPNAACGELAVLLHSSEGGRLWNHPLTLTASNKSYHLRLEPAKFRSLGAELLHNLSKRRSDQRKTD